MPLFYLKPNRDMCRAAGRTSWQRPSVPLPEWVLAACLSLPLAAQAAPSTAFETTTQLAGSALLLNGAGTRTRAFFRVYDMALYTQRKVNNPADLLALGGPKRLHFVALRELPGTDLGLLFIKGLQANSPKELVAKHTISTTRFIEIFSGKAKLNPGETFSMDFVPDKGTQFYINNQAQGGPVGDAEFFNMVLRIWVGPSPVDGVLRDELLGIDRRPIQQ